MTVYNVCLFVPLLLQLVNVFLKKKQNTFFSCLVFLLYALVACNRSYSVGTDMVNYLTRFNIVADCSFADFPYLNAKWGFEYGFLVLYKLLSMVGLSERGFVIFTSLFTLISVYRFVLKYSKAPCLSMFFYCLFMMFGTSLNLVRLFLALGICLYALDFLICKKFLQFTITIIFASLFHTSALVFLLIYIFKFVHLTKINIIFFFVACIITYLFGDKIVSLLMRSFSTYYYERYGSLIGEGSGTGMLLMLIVIFVFCMFHYRMVNKMDENFSIWLQMVLICIGLTVLALHLNVAARLTWYFKTALIILLPNTFLNIKLKSKKEAIVLAAIIIVACFFPYFFYYIPTMATDNAGIIPYYAA